MTSNSDHLATSSLIHTSDERKILELGSAIANANCLVHDLAHDQDFARTHDLTTASDLARDLVTAFENVINLDLNHAAASANALGIADDLGRALYIADTIDVPRTRDLAAAISIARNLAYQLAGFCHGRQTAQQVSADHPQADRLARVAPSAGWLLATAARLLPAPDRARYREEYHSELHDLASAGAGRLHQLRYAARQLTRTAHLRRAIMTPRRKHASP